MLVPWPRTLRRIVAGSIKRTSRGPSPPGAVHSATSASLAARTVACLPAGTYNAAGDFANVLYDVERHAQFRRRASPEEIARRRCDDAEVGLEVMNAPPDLGRGKVRELTVDEQDLVAGLFQEVFGISVLERKVRLAAAEIDAAIERPIRIDKCESHVGTSL